MTYLNANATTPMHKKAIKIIAEMYAHAINVHSDDTWATQTAAQLDAFSARLTADLGFVPLFVSGASEANAMAVSSFAQTYPDGRIVTTLVEHSGMLAGIKHTGMPVSYMHPHKTNIYNEMCCFTSTDSPGAGADRGDTTDSSVATTPTLTQTPMAGPVMFCIIHGNNETGYINDVCSMARLIKIVYPTAIVHVDAVQTFCKAFINTDMFDAGVDSVTVSFHKVRGPHVGMLLHRPGTYLRPLIHGSQQNGLRGGTLPAALLLASAYVYVKAARDHEYTFAALVAMRRRIIDILASRFVVVDVQKAVISTDICICRSNAGRHLDLFAEPHIQIFGMNGDSVLPNTVFMVVYDPEGRFCNVECKQYLHTQDIVIGIGSACMTKNAGASHIAEAYKLNRLQKRGLLRLSFLPKTPHLDAAIGKLAEYIHGILYAPT